VDDIEGDVDDKEEIVFLTNTTPEPRTVVVELLDTIIADVAVGGPRRSENVAGIAVLQLEKVAIFGELGFSPSLQVWVVVEEIGLEFRHGVQPEVLLLVLGDDPRVSEGGPQHEEKTQDEGYGDRDHEGGRVHGQENEQQESYNEVSQEVVGAIA